MILRNPQSRGRLGRGHGGLPHLGVKPAVFRLVIPVVISIYADKSFTFVT